MVKRGDVSGKISEDPLTELPIGSEIQFAPIQFGSSNAKQQTEFVTNWGFFNGAILALGIKHRNSFDLVGSAVMVAPGLAVTATHTLIENVSGMKEGLSVPYCFGIRPSELNIWRTEKVSYNDFDDIAYLSLRSCSQLPADKTYYRFGITTRAPKNGEELHIVGFRRETIELDRIRADIAANLVAACGPVQAVYPNGRDRLLLPCPVVELNCGSLGGMSGGAVFDANGLLVGIVSRGLQTLDGEGPTYASWIINSLARPLEIVWPPGLLKKPASPLMMDKRLILIDRPEALDGSTETHTKYRVWFE